MKFLPLDNETQIAFALGRSFGNAVERNRGRRRLNSAFREAFRQHQQPASLRAEFDRVENNVDEADYRCGAYLLAGNRGLLTDDYAKICSDVVNCLSSASVSPAHAQSMGNR